MVLVVKVGTDELLVFFIRSSVMVLGKLFSGYS